MKKLLVLAVAMMVTFALALPATAQDKADWSFYGSVRMWTAWESVDDDTPPQLSSSGGFFTIAVTDAKAQTFGTTTTDDDELAWLLQGNSRIGANVKWGNVGGRFEYGSGPNLRLLYGTWNFGPGTLTVGQDYGPYFFLISGLCGPGGQECNGIGFGSIYSGRNPQIKLTMGGFKFALEKPTKTATYTLAYPATPISGVATANVAQDTDTTLPRISASYSFNLGPASLFVGGMYNTYDAVYNVGGAEKEFSVDAWVLGAGARMGFGPFYANASFQYGSNPNNVIGIHTLYPSVLLYNTATDRDEDAEYMAAQLVLGFKLSDSISFEGGFVWQDGEVDDPTLASTTWSQSTYTYYLQMVWSPVKNVFFVPEVGVIDYDSLEVTGQNDVNFGDLTWVGMKWMINF